ncbi:MAG: FtsW/RodA/SpoVE family cell cycle protein, partial [Bacteroidota bacterium]
YALARVKGNLSVRSRTDFLLGVLFSIVLVFGSLYLVHVAWSSGRALTWAGKRPRLAQQHPFSGDQLLLPIVHALSGLGFILMLSLRDPIRDTALGLSFAWGVLLGAGALWLASRLDVQRLRRPADGWQPALWVPLAGSVALFLALVLFGSGPTGSDAKVNVFGFQPAELVKLLMVAFLAAYFSRRWELLRSLRERGTESGLLRRLNVPRLQYVVPVFAGAVVALALFLGVRDLGPALVLGLTFLTLYAVARQKIVVPLLGLAALVGGFWAISEFGLVSTVASRIEMMRSPWDNFAYGGDHLANVFWSISTGRWTGMGPGLGSGSFVPAAHTDMVLAALAEDLGFLGVLVVAGLYGVLIARGLRISLRAGGPYSFFLSLGLVLLVSYQIVLIAGGVLGVVPLSGVVTPFLSFGKTSMIVNAGIVGLLAAVSAQSSSERVQPAFGKPVRFVRWALAGIALLLVGRFAFLESNADELIVRPALVVRGDGERGFQYNRRLAAARETLPRGTIYDRNGLALASNEPDIWREQEALLRGQFDVSIDTVTTRRQYPFGPLTFYLLGDARTDLKRQAGNGTYLEYEREARLQGYNDRPERVLVKNAPADSVRIARTVYDYSELIPLMRNRFRAPDFGRTGELLDRDRSLTTTIDIRLQRHAADVLARDVAEGLYAAAVVIDPTTGEVLASVTHPLPTQVYASPTAANDDPSLFDRVVYGQYPPGSTFKIVTAMAALNSPNAGYQTRHVCRPLGDGRVGNVVPGYRRPVRDARGDPAHGNIGLSEALVVSCNAYFAQLGVLEVGAPAILGLIDQFDLGVSTRPTLTRHERLLRVRNNLAQTSFGQGPLLATPLEVAQIAGTVANGGRWQPARFTIDADLVIPEGTQIISEPDAGRLAQAMREVVTRGTARRIQNSSVEIAGKTGTAEAIIDGKRITHAWFAGFTRTDAGTPVAVAVIVERGGSGGRIAAPIAADILEAAAALR